MIFWEKAHSLAMVDVCNLLQIKGLLPSNVVHKTGFPQKITASERGNEEPQICFRLTG